MDEVTGRDNQIICQALKIAIPIMQKHSLSASNTHDMERIYEHRSKGNRVEFGLNPKNSFPARFSNARSEQKKQP